MTFNGHFQKAVPPTFENKPTPLGAMCLTSSSSYLLFLWGLAGNIFICQPPSFSAGGEAETEDEEDEGIPTGVVYKIGKHCNTLYRPKVYAGFLQQLRLSVYCWTWSTAWKIIL